MFKNINALLDLLQFNRLSCTKDTNIFCEIRCLLDLILFCESIIIILLNMN